MARSGRSASNRNNTGQMWIRNNDLESDHRKIGSKQKLWTHHPSSPGSPIFTPEGTYVFQRLQEFLRAQFPAFGFLEVVTPTLYKQSLWEQSGHWENYKNEMFTVSGGKQIQHPKYEDFSMQPRKSLRDDGEGTFGLKPMNCPGHCLLFASQRRSYNDLPIRYADFSPLHRDEVSGALTGLTRVRRFHQDDGHIFCRPSQVQEEVVKSLELMKLVYDAVGIKKYHFALSTRPERDYIGTADEWKQAEAQLQYALDGVAENHEYHGGQGAFYGPKIDALMLDSDKKKHQIGTIQLDFQLPKRFDLSFVAPKSEIVNDGAPKSEPRILTKGEVPSSADQTVPVAPVMIHRAILGSLERFIALLIEQNKGKWPFWLNPHPIVILTVTDEPSILNFAESVAEKLRFPGGLNEDSKPTLPRPAHATHYKVDLDKSNETLAKKVVLAKQKGYAIIVIVGPKNQKDQHMDVDVSNILDQVGMWTVIESVKPGSQSPVQKASGVGIRVGRHYSGLWLNVEQLQQVMKMMTDRYL